MDKPLAWNRIDSAKERAEVNGITATVIVSGAQSGQWWIDDHRGGSNRANGVSFTVSYAKEVAGRVLRAFAAAESPDVDHVDVDYERAAIDKMAKQLTDRVERFRVGAVQLLDRLARRAAPEQDPALPVLDGSALMQSGEWFSGPARLDFGDGQYCTIGNLDMRYVRETSTFEGRVPEFSARVKVEPVQKASSEAPIQWTPCGDSCWQADVGDWRLYAWSSGAWELQKRSRTGRYYPLVDDMPCEDNLAAAQRRAALVFHAFSDVL